MAQHDLKLPRPAARTDRGRAPLLCFLSFTGEFDAPQISSRAGCKLVETLPIAHDLAGRHRLTCSWYSINALSSQDATHRTGLEISALDINQERTHAVL